MDLPHTMEVVEHRRVGTEDGTPILDDVTVWRGPCRLDEPARRASRQGATGTVGVLRTFAFVPPDAVVTDTTHVWVTTHTGRQRWRVDGVLAATGFGGLVHHQEVELSREVAP